MKETKYHFQPTAPYSLHDMRVDSVKIVGDSLLLHFEDGFVKPEEPFPRVQGSIEVTGIDADFCCVQILSRFGHFGGYRGRKLELGEFLKEYPDFRFEIVDELHAYNQVELAGYLSLPNKTVLREMELSLYFSGEMIYRTEERE